MNTEKMVTEKYLVRHLLSIQQASEEGDLDNAYWLPGAENPADGLTRVRCDLVPLLRLLESGGFHRGPVRPLRGVTRRVATDVCNFAIRILACASHGPVISFCPARFFFLALWNSAEFLLSLIPYVPVHP